MNESCVVCPSKKPRRAQPDLLVCLKCSNRVLAWLSDLEQHLPQLSLIRARKGQPGRAPGFASTPPCNLDSLHHADWRAHGYDALDGLSAMGTIHRWAQGVRDTRQLDMPKGLDLSTEMGALRANHGWIMAQPAVVEYVSNLKQVRAAVRAVAGDPLPRRVGTCITVTAEGECHGSVYEVIEGDGGVRCNDCGRHYTGYDLYLLQLAQKEAA